MKVVCTYAEDYSGYTTIEVDIPAGVHPWHWVRENHAEIAREAVDLEINWNDPYDSRITQIVVEETGEPIDEPEESPPETQEYLVVGVYADDKQRYATSVVARSPEDAETQVRSEIEAEGNELIVAAVLLKGRVVA